MKTLICLYLQKKKREAQQQEDEVFELLFCHMALHLFMEPDQAIDILKVRFTQTNSPVLQQSKFEINIKINQSMERSIDRSMDQSINQPTNQTDSPY